MWKQIVAIVMLVFISTGIQQAAAQSVQEPQLTNRGILLEPLKYAVGSSMSLGADAALCVINTHNEGPQWFLLSTDAGITNERIGTLAPALHVVTAIKASTNGRYLAVHSVGEGHPVIEIIDLSKLLQKKTYHVLQTIDPYPGTIKIHSWDGTQLLVECDMLLTHLDKTQGRAPEELALSWQEVFAVNALTGEISGFSDGAKNPAEHYSKVLLDKLASDAEKDMALTKLLNLHSRTLTLPYLIQVLDQEQDPKRINKILDKINKLRQ